MKKTAFILAMILIVTAGTSYGYFNKAAVSNTGSMAINASGDDPADTRFPEGAKIYKEKCAACHQVTGMGVPNAFPPLKGSDYLLSNKKRAVQQVLNGSNKEITVNGVTYKMPMPPQVDNYVDAVNVINYVLNAWGNDGGTITADEVKDIKIVR